MGALKWLWVALGGLEPAQFRRSRRAGSETGVTAALDRAPPPELTDCLSPTLFRPHSVLRLATHSRHVSYLPCIPRNGEPASSDGKFFVPGPRLFDGKLCFTQCFRQVPPGANPLLLSGTNRATGFPFFNSTKDVSWHCARSTQSSKFRAASVTVITVFFTESEYQIVCVSQSEPRTNNPPA